MYKYDLVAMHERAQKAIFALQRNQIEVSARMGIDTSIPLHKRMPLPPTEENICKAAEVLGVSVKWLITGVPATETDRFVIQQVSGNINGSVVIKGNRNCEIVVRNAPAMGI